MGNNPSQTNNSLYPEQSIQSEKEEMVQEHIEYEIRQLQIEQNFFTKRSKEIAQDFKKEMYLDTPSLQYLETVNQEFQEMEDGTFIPQKHSQTAINKCIQELNNQSLRRVYENIEEKTEKQIELNKTKRERLKELQQQNQQLKMTLEEMENKIASF